MNANPEIASDWKGSILMHVATYENDKPKKGVEDIVDDSKKAKKDEEEAKANDEVPP